VGRKPKNPFDVKPVQPHEQFQNEFEPEDPDAEEKYILGQSTRFFNQRETMYANTEIERFRAILEASPTTKTFVHEILLAEIELQRHDERVQKAIERVRTINRNNTKNKSDEEVLMGTEKDTMGMMEKYEKIRAKLMKRYTDACEALGAMPKDAVRNMENEETITDVHRRYIAELNMRRSNGQAVGRMSAAAKRLALEKGMNPEDYTASGVVKDPYRKGIQKEFKKMTRFK